MSDKDSLEEQNIANLFEFYEAELRLVLEGARRSVCVLFFYEARAHQDMLIHTH
jgi:hypothetical protein